MKVNLTVKREVNDHDGYCSGAENEYVSNIITLKVELPEQYNSLSVGSTIIDYDWIKELKCIEPDLNTDGSYYCDNGKIAVENGLGIHDYKLTVLTAIVVEDD